LYERAEFEREEASLNFGFFNYRIWGSFFLNF